MIDIYCVGGLAFGAIVFVRAKHAFFYGVETKLAPLVLQIMGGVTPSAASCRAALSTAIDEVSTTPARALISHILCLTTQTPRLILTGQAPI